MTIFNEKIRGRRIITLFIEFRFLQGSRQLILKYSMDKLVWFFHIMNLNSIPRYGDV